MRKSLIILSACALFFTTSCSSDYLDLKPNSSTSTETIFETTENVKLAVNGLSRMMTHQYLGSQGFNGEELSAPGTVTIQAMTTRRVT